jgi:NADPH2:quinone reductase
MSTADVIRIHKHGGPEEMKFEQVDLPSPGPGQARLRQTAIGLNFIDVYTRTGLYPGPTPSVLGVEAAGVVPLRDE